MSQILGMHFQIALIEFRSASSEVAD